MGTNGVVNGNNKRLQNNVKFLNLDAIFLCNNGCQNKRMAWGMTLINSTKVEKYKVEDEGWDAKRFSIPCHSTCFTPTSKTSSIGAKWHAP
jgi:hypothetical protein